MWFKFYARNTTCAHSDWLCPGHCYFSWHSQSHARYFNQSDDRNLPMRNYNCCCCCCCRRRLCLFVFVFCFVFCFFFCFFFYFVFCLFWFVVLFCFVFVFVFVFVFLFLFFVLFCFVFLVFYFCFCFCLFFFYFRGSTLWNSPFCYEKPRLNMWKEMHVHENCWKLPLHSFVRQT